MQNDDRWKLITPRMCLSHTTGLPNIRWFHPITGEMDTLGVMRLYFKPGEKYAYSGEGFKLLQLAIEESMDKKIDEIAQEKYLSPWACTEPDTYGTIVLATIMLPWATSIMALSM